MSVILQVNNVSVKAGKRFLLHEINWEVCSGEHWLVFGMNGSGKTTLLSMLAGYRSPSEGNIELLGKEFTSETIFHLRRSVGWVSSSFFDKYYHHEQALQIVLSGITGSLNIDDTITDANLRDAKALLRELNLIDKAYAPFANMSKGERQSILIARALLTNPQILILDEPCTGLDINARNRMMSLVNEMSQDANKTILYVTHYPEELQSFMNKTLILRNGCVFAQGNTSDVFTEHNLSRLLGEPVQISNKPDGSVRINFI